MDCSAASLHAADPRVQPRHRVLRDHRQRRSSQTASGPPTYDNSYFYGDYVCSKIFELKPKSGGGFTRTEFATGLGEGGAVAMAFGPHGSGQALYYTT